MVDNRILGGMLKVSALLVALDVHLAAAESSPLRVASPSANEAPERIARLDAPTHRARLSFDRIDTMSDGAELADPDASALRHGPLPNHEGEGVRQGETIRDRPLALADFTTGSSRLGLLHRVRSLEDR